MNVENDWPTQKSYLVRLEAAVLTYSSATNFEGPGDSVVWQIVIPAVRRVYLFFLSPVPRALRIYGVVNVGKLLVHYEKPESAVNFRVLATGDNALRGIETRRQG
jgi:hypothetical protein